MKSAVDSHQQSCTETEIGKHRRAKTSTEAGVNQSVLSRRRNLPAQELTQVANLYEPAPAGRAFGPTTTPRFTITIRLADGTLHHQPVSEANAPAFSHIGRATHWIAAPLYVAAYEGFEEAEKLLAAAPYIAMATHNFEAMASKLDDPNSDLRAKGTQAIEIRDNIESYCQGQQYGAFLNHLVPVFLRILDGNPVFISTSPEQVRRLFATPI
ncbi:Transcription-associated protein 1 [Pyrenophora tritici-repentis]|nr:Transcription-associated protein 1 [Pyrenophora tritici-repentis]KAI1548058.1 transcription-associated protein 1 [Pyrenophora tritici-repentis]KAI1578152.1 transcription-associated protein 1 [Pyrenophora tritici-repentis]PWO29584.1 hypothetical protein PtrARCrB10_01786 [Pyrenophora tritici-repentis]